MAFSSLRSFVCPLAAFSLASAVSVPLVTFDGAPATAHHFKALDDPVMGGKSTGTWQEDAAKQEGILDGEVVNVPSLKAPGFIKAASDGTFADASAVVDGDLVLMVRSSTPDYKGFRVAFASGTLSPAYACGGGGSIPLSRGCFKAKFSVPAGSDFAEVRVPFTSFSDLWSPATGEQTKTCAQEADACPTAKRLSSIKRFELWAEGVNGKVHLEVKSISAESKQLKKVPSAYNTCKSPVQKNLFYNISSRTEPTVPVAVDPSESLAQAVCCDNRTAVYAEPQFLYQAPDIALYSKMKGVTTFYDSTCGLPLFRTPVNRTFADFKSDTDEHGWPSFRKGEVFEENVKVDSNGFVFSTCGTHVGSYLPDDKGARWCIDLSCIAGRPPKDEEVQILV
eukprot:TRINITY_DN12336_c2_g1_i2.p1 TRINITY_DN12336_c2_g1~~TRINITY_DN12336_c2_g1_i2.p1  ORF type:complete len:394 (+),score=78.61 TRINITY_DN12336_c2_g1_i2:68-1249(+)